MANTKQDQPDTKHDKAGEQTSGKPSAYPDKQGERPMTGTETADKAIRDGEKDRPR